MNQKSSERAPPTHCKWSAADDHFLMNNWGRMHIDDLTRSLGRTRRGVYARAGKLGLSRPSAWPKEHDQMLRKRYEDEGPRALAAALGRNDASAIIENANVQVDLPSGVWVRCPSECTEQQAPDSSAAESRQVDPGGG